MGGREGESEGREGEREREREGGREREEYKWEGGMMKSNVLLYIIEATCI